MVRSFLNKGEDKLFFETKPNEFFRQVKKLGLEQRKRFLASGNAEDFFKEMVDRCDYLQTEWNKGNPDFAIINVDMTTFINSKEYCEKILHQIGVDTDETTLDKMLLIVDKNRFKQRKHLLGFIYNKNLLKFVRDVTPPFIYALAKKLTKVRTKNS